MRRAAYILGLVCVIVSFAPASLRAATDTNSRAAAKVKVMTDLAVASLPHTAENTLPRSAALSKIKKTDAHPIITEFFGPAPEAKIKPAAAKTPVPPLKLESNLSHPE